MSGILIGLMFWGWCLADQGTGKMSQETKKGYRPPIRITVVRHDERTGRELLRNYIFGGFRTPPSVPRGIEPRLVSQFIEDELKPDSLPDAYAKTVRVLRFYERADCLPHLRKVLTGQEKTIDDIYRSAYVCQAFGDVGTRQEADEIATYFDTRLVGHPKSIDGMDVLLETLVVLSPSGSDESLSKRIAREVNARKAAENRDEEGMRAYQKIAAIQRLKLPQAQGAVDEKKKLLSMPVEERIPELISIYMGTSSLSDDLMMTWAGRMLRKVAMEGDPGPIYQAFTSQIAKVDAGKVGEDSLADTTVSRAAQAILYLQGELTKSEYNLYRKTKLGALNFLWDDLPEPPPVKGN